MLLYHYQQALVQLGRYDCTHYTRYTRYTHYTHYTHYTGASAVRSIRVSMSCDVKSTQEAFSFLRFVHATGNELMVLPSIYTHYARYTRYTHYTRYTRYTLYSYYRYYPPWHSCCTHSTVLTVLYSQHCTHSTVLILFTSYCVLTIQVLLSIYSLYSYCTGTPLHILTVFTVLILYRYSPPWAPAMISCCTHSTVLTVLILYRYSPPWAPAMISCCTHSTILILCTAGTPLHGHRL
jgi:hypothetical protein